MSGGIRGLPVIHNGQACDEWRALHTKLVTQRYPKIETNMFVIGHTNQAASFSVWSVAKH
jgi:hypothetical protein